MCDTELYCLGLHHAVSNGTYFHFTKLFKGILKCQNGSPCLLRCTLLPSPIPKALFSKANALQQEFNLIYHKASRNHEFLERILGPKLWSIYKNIRKEKNIQALMLGLNRSDYMLHLNPNIEESRLKMLVNRLKKTELAANFSIENDETFWEDLSLRQVEFNMIACSFGGLSQRIVSFHRITLPYFDVTENLNERVPDCKAADNFAEAILLACEHYVEDVIKFYGKSNSKLAVLVIVDEKENNIYDQKCLTGLITLKNPKIKSLYRSFNYLKYNIKLDNHNRLFVDDHEIAVIYYRTGYTPDAFPDEETWNVKYELEKSLAIKCPCIQYLLVNTKLIQAALCQPKYLNQFIDSNNPNYQLILSTFALQYALTSLTNISDEDEIKKVLENCYKNPASYVLKPQREGGGNNYFGDQMIEKLKSIQDQSERIIYVLMERIHPYVFENYILDSNKPTSSPKCVQMVGELGIYGAFLADEKSRLRAFINERLDRTGEKEKLKDLLRTRLSESGWREELKSHCRDLIRDRGLENVTVDDLVTEITPVGRRMVPDSVKEELLDEIRSFLSKETDQLS